jgi:hypothetical protein
MACESVQNGRVVVAEELQDVSGGERRSGLMGVQDPVAEGILPGLMHVRATVEDVEKL